MRVSFAKAADKYLGGILCYILSCCKKKDNISKERLKKAVQKKVLFIQLWGIGETICTLPAIKAFSKRFKDTEIHVLATKRNSAVYENVNYINNLISIPADLISVLRFAWKNKQCYDIIIDMEEYLNISAIVAHICGKSAIGYSGRARSRLYDKSVKYNDRKHVVFAFGDLVRLLGVKEIEGNLDTIKSDKETDEAVKKILSLYNIKKNEMIIGLGTGTAESAQSRKWPKANFAKLAEVLAEKYKAKIIFFGSTNEANDIDSIIGMMKSCNDHVINIAGKTNAKQFFSLIKMLDIFIGNDSGPMHVAAAQGIKTIGLFGPNLPVRFGPFSKKGAYVYKGNVCEFSPCINVHKGEVPDCLYKRSSDDYQKCMKAISVDDVIESVEGLDISKTNKKDKTNTCEDGIKK